MRSTHSGRLENYLGTQTVEELSGNMRGWYGPPIAVDGVPGQVFVTGDGDFIGECREGFEVTFMDRAEQLRRRIKSALRAASGNNKNRLSVGFATLEELINNAKYNGKAQQLQYSKTGQSSSNAGAGDLFFASGAIPAVGANASAAPGGRACDFTLAGAIGPQQNAATGESLFLVSQEAALTAASSVLFYDRLFDVLQTNDTTAQAVTGVPTRYQNTTPGAEDWAGGNFVFPETAVIVGTATAHNHTVCTYLDQAGNASTIPSIAGSASTINTVGAVDLLTAVNVFNWFMPLEVGDSGIQALTQIQKSATFPTGQLQYTIGHPLAWCGHVVARFSTANLGINTAFSMVRVFDGACISGLANIVNSVHMGSLTLVST